QPRGIDHRERRSHGNPKPPVPPAQGSGPIAISGLQRWQPLISTVADRLHGRGETVGDILQLVLPNFEKSAIAAEPKPAAIVRHNLRDIIVVKPAIAANHRETA